MSDDSRQSCQFYYFNWNKSNDELHQILDKIVNGKNDLIKIKYSGKPELLKGTISLTKNYIPYEPSFCFNIGKRALLMTGNSLVRDMVARKLAYVVDPRQKITPLARMTVQDVMDVANKLLDEHSKNKVPFPKFSFGFDQFDDKQGHKYQVVHNMIRENVCGIRNNPMFTKMFERCKEVDGKFTFDSRIYQYPGIADIDSGFEKLKLSKHYSFSTYNRHLTIDQWFTFSEHILNKPLLPNK